MCDVIISIREKWWNLIVSGEKTLELRKTIAKRNILGVYIWDIEPFTCYAYVPEKKAVCGSFQCAEFIVIGQNEEHRSCVPYVKQEEYRRQGRGGLYGWKVQRPKAFNLPLLLSEYGLRRPPQSWQYIKGKQE